MGLKRSSAGADLVEGIVAAARAVLAPHSAFPTRMSTAPTGFDPSDVKRIRHVRNPRLGMTAYLTQSILPGLVTHSLGLLTFFALIWPRDPARRLVWDGGADPWFWLHSGQALLFAALALLAFRRLAGMTARRRAGPDGRGVPALAGEPAE